MGRNQQKRRQLRDKLWLATDGQRLVPVTVTPATIAMGMKLIANLDRKPRPKMAQKD